ncbi:MAG: DNA replication/repair protein RecF [Alphaproteobacteria bacterium]|nr:DNA replication/repair protein RecF [Alphaproteobacteria bacterium]
MSGEAGAPPALRLTRLTLTGFRSYESLAWRPAGRMAAIAGPNGSGKTNLLEAISLLSPGRGLRGAKVAEYLRQGEQHWAVAGRFETPAGETDIGTGTEPEGPADRRVFRLDGTAPRSQAEIAERVAAVWLTPQMDRLFQEGASGRRRFLDRLVYAVEPGHAREVTAYETATASRNRLLAEGRADRGWLAGTEDAMARHAVAATAARADLVTRLNAALAAGAAGDFPAARAGLACPIGERLAGGPALAAEDWLRETLAANRARDAAAGGAAIGAHRADMTLADAGTGLAAALASTGQQKALLIGVILGHAALITAARGFGPLLLLDEPAVHLDSARRVALFAALARLPAQVFLTGTDIETFAPLRGIAEAVLAGGGTLRPAPGFEAAGA